MTVRIDEVVTETAPEPPAARGTGGEGGGGMGPTDDLDRLEQALERRRHRVARLWAD